MSAQSSQPPRSSGRENRPAASPADAARDYRQAAEEFRESLELLEKLQQEDREGGRRRELHRTLRRRVRRGFRRLQEARKLFAAEDTAERGESAAGDSSGAGGSADAAYQAAEKAEQLFNRLVLAGGEGLLEQEESRGDVRDRVAGALAAALRNYLQPDDRYQPFIRLEALPEGLRLFLRRIFPVLLGPPSGYDPATGTTVPTGIDDPAEEEVRHTDFIRLPLSQARELLSEELIPSLEEKLRRGGGEETERALRTARERLAELEQIRLEPRAKPFVPERGFYTEQITRFSPKGELLVSLRIPGTVRTGTNLDRIREMVKMELVWRLAGKGVCRALDEELEWVKSRASGSEGSAIYPRSRLDVQRNFDHLRRSFPVLTALDSREGTRRLLEGTAGAIERGGKGLLRRRLRALIGAELPSPPGESS
jgi:hypothetical protein